MPITTLPALDRISATFKADVDTFFGTQLPAFATEANALETNVNAKEVTASAAASTATTKATEASGSAASASVSANAAAASAATAVNAPGTSATSTTSVAIGTGSKSLTIQTGKSLVAGMWIVVADSAAPETNYMTGAITSYNSGTGALVFTSATTGGSGTKTAWTVSLSGVSPLVTSIVGITGTISQFNTAVTDADLAVLGANTFTGQQTFKELKDTVYTITDGAAFEIDPANGSVQIVTLGASRTPAATNFEAGQTVVLGIDDGTAYSVTWTTINPTWTKVGGSGAAPTLAATGKTWIVLWKVGSTMYASHLGDG